MTSETEFSTFTATELREAVEDAVEIERGRFLAAFSVLALPVFLLGLIVGWLVS